MRLESGWQVSCGPPRRGSVYRVHRFNENSAGLAEEAIRRLA